MFVISVFLTVAILAFPVIWFLFKRMEFKHLWYQGEPPEKTKFLLSFLTATIVALVTLLEVSDILIKQPDGLRQIPAVAHKAKWKWNPPKENLLQSVFRMTPLYKITISEDNDVQEIQIKETVNNYYELDWLKLDQPYYIEIQTCYQNYFGVKCSSEYAFGNWSTKANLSIDEIVAGMESMTESLNDSTNEESYADLVFTYSKAIYKNLRTRDPQYLELEKLRQSIFKIRQKAESVNLNSEEVDNIFSDITNIIIQSI